MKAISGKTKKDILALCEYIFEFESEDYESMKEEGEDVDNHVYAIAERIHEALNKR